ncbi:FGGY-family carbohydrate kinase [Pengzhenrongella frigida]|uniref:FGGY-family carbohydrate kinase n=1 Tax=Pengzhenrongella frigida TaxID=1259133 RepID=UPI0013EA12AB|nr:FGGY family carbohydrate kinase [Cellulomonas sp. HLT2-17]
MPDAGLVLSIDQGTTNAKALLVDPRTGRAVASGAVAVGISFPAPGWVEQDPAEIWSATVGAVTACLAAAAGAVPVAIAVTNQRESVVAWNRRTGAPLGPVLGWQDARTAAACDQLVAAGVADEVRARTGLSLDPMFSAPKMRLLLDRAVAAGVAAEDVCLGTVDAWLIWNLTGGAVFATEAGNASRTLLFDLTSLDWHPRLLEVFGIPATALPEVRASDAGFGVTAAGVLPAGVPIVAVLADSHAALYHHGCTEPGAGKATYGTGSSIMTPCLGPDAAPAGIATTLAWLTAVPTYAREGNILASGSALDWMARTLGGDADRSGGAFLTELAADADDTGGVHLVPAFTGLGAPYWDRAATGVVTGVTGGTTRSQLARAALEAVAHQVADVVEAIESDGRARIDVLHADGGATASGLLMQLQADLIGRPVHVADASEASALGVALLAARTLGLVPTDPIGGTDQASEATAPAIGATERAARRRAWATAVARSRGRTVPPDGSVATT